LRHLEEYVLMITYKPVAIRLLGGALLFIASISSGYAILFSAPSITAPGESGEPVLAVAFSDDGNTLAVVVETEHTLADIHSGDSPVKLWDARTGKPLRALPHPLARTVAFLPDGKSLVSCSADSLKVWDYGTGKLQRTIKLEGSVHSTALSPDGKRVLVGGYNTRKIDALIANRSRAPESELRVFETSTGKQLLTIPSEADVNAAIFSPDGRTLISGHLDRALRVWDAQTGKLLEIHTAHTDAILAVAVSPDGRRIASAGRDSQVVLRDVETKMMMRRLKTDAAWALALAFSPDGKRLASGSTRGIQIWDTATGELIKTFNASWTQSLAFSPDGKYLASGIGIVTERGWITGETNLWNAQTGQLLQTLK
jgi:WD40 repeat protein